MGNYHSQNEDSNDLQHSFFRNYFYKYNIYDNVKIF